MANSIFIPDFPLTLPLSPDSGGEGGVRGDSHGAFYATLRVTHAFTPFGGRFAVSSYYLLLATRALRLIPFWGSNPFPFFV